MEVVHYPNPILKQSCAEVDPATDKSLEDLASQMLDVMYEEKGIGLAATQVGVLKRVVVIDLDPENSRPMVLLNPRVIETSEETEEEVEGCLSFRGMDVPVERPCEVVVETLSLDGNTVRLEANDMFARCLQHEIDHLDGVTMLDRAKPEDRKEALAKARRQVQS